MAGDIFSIEASSRFASALANQDGIKVRQQQDNTMPYTDTSGKIHVGIPSIYNHEEYMGGLHGEIGKQVEEVSYFRDITLEEGSLQDVCRDIIQTEVTERHRHGVFDGRDRILRANYDKKLRDNGGMPQIIEALAEDNPTVAAVMYLNNEMRNDWQGYHHCPPSRAIQSELDRLGFLEEEWLSLETKEDLQQLLHRIEFEEPPEEPPSGGDGNDGEGDDGDSQGSDEGGEGSGDGADDSSGQPEGDDGESQDGGDPAEPSAGGSGEKPEEEREAQGDPGIGAGAGAQKLKDMGLVKKPMIAQDAYYEEQDDVPYTPDHDHREQVVADMQRQGAGDKEEAILQTLGGFSLSRRVKRFLLSQKQTGYDYGKKRGKLCSKNVAKLYTGGVNPTIFKQKQASKIQTDCAFFVLGDCSGSMSGRKYLTSAAAQIALSEVLQTLRIPHAMMQFTTSYHGREHYHMKGFAERFVSRDTLIQRYGHDNINMGCNADGEAVTRAAQMLAARPEAQKILVVLSDGSPAHGHNDSRFLKDTVQSIEKSKVMHIIGIGIQDTNVKRFYTDCKVINQVHELEPVLLQLLKDKVLR